MRPPGVRSDRAASPTPRPRAPSWTAGTGQTLSVTFTPTDTTDYNTASDTVTINVDKATPTHRPGPTPPTSPTARRSRPPSSMRPPAVAGSWTVGTLHPGRGHGPDRRHRPDPLGHLSRPPTRPITTPSTTAATINVQQGHAHHRPGPTPPTSPTARRSRRHPARCHRPCRVSRAVVRLHPGRGHRARRRRGQTLSVTFTPTDTTDYNAAPTTATINVDKATPTHHLGQPRRHHLRHARSAPPSSMPPPYGAGQTSLYTPGRGTVLSGRHRTRPSRSPSRPRTRPITTPLTATATINVDKATPTITWANPADITYGTALRATQLDATAVRRQPCGHLRLHARPTGTVLTAGPGQILSVAFTPTDTTDYNAASDTVTINVDKATPTITWANPADITYGTASGRPSSMRTALPWPGQRTVRDRSPSPGRGHGARPPARARPCRSPSRPPTRSITTPHHHRGHDQRATRPRPRSPGPTPPTSPTAPRLAR